MLLRSMKSRPLLFLIAYIPLQQHLSTVLFVSLHNSFPLFCFSQQHVFTSLPVRVQTSFGEAADTMVATVNAAISGGHFVILFIDFASFNYLVPNATSLILFQYCCSRCVKETHPKPVH